MTTVTMPQLNIGSPQTEEEFRSNIGSLIGQRNQKRAELTLVELQIRDQKQQLQSLRLQQSRVQP